MLKSVMKLRTWQRCSVRFGWSKFTATSSRKPHAASAAQRKRKVCTDAVNITWLMMMIDWIWCISTYKMLWIFGFDRCSVYRLTNQSTTHSVLFEVVCRPELWDISECVFFSWRGVWDWRREQRLSEGYSQRDAESGLQLLLLPFCLLLGLAVCHDDSH